MTQVRTEALSIDSNLKEKCGEVQHNAQLHSRDILCGLADSGVGHFSLAAA